MRFKAPVRYVRTPVLSTNPVTGDPVVTKKMALVDETVTAISVEGEQFKADKDGVVDVPDRLAPRLLAEGWQAVGPSEPAASAPPAGAGATGAGSQPPAGGSTSGSGSAAGSGGNRSSGGKPNG